MGEGMETGGGGGGEEEEWGSKDGHVLMLVPSVTKE